MNKTSSPTLKCQFFLVLTLILSWEIYGVVLIFNAKQMNSQSVGRTLPPHQSSRTSHRNVHSVALNRFSQRNLPSVCVKLNSSYFLSQELP